LASPVDDADLRQILAATPMPGSIRVSFRREPSYFAGAGVDGRFRQVVAARDLDSGRLIAFGCRSLMPRWVNGRPRSIGYLSNFRVLAEHRNRGVLARGYVFLRQLHRDEQTRLYLTTIAETNQMARELLTSGRTALPRYHDAGRYYTLALPVQRKLLHRRDTTGIKIRPARREDLGRMVQWLHMEGPRRQFFQLYQVDDFGTETGIFKALRPEHILLAWSGGQLAGMVAGWDQTSFRQTVVDGYGWGMNVVRLLSRVVPRWLGGPALPRPGETLRYLTVALPVVHGDDPHVFAVLIEALRERAAGAYRYLLLGLHESDPLLTTAYHWRARRYVTRLYLACWDDGEPLREALDDRPPYLEPGCL
jgi:hypothetical protein